MNLTYYKQQFAAGKEALLRTIERCDEMIAFCSVNKIGFSHWTEKKTVAQLRIQRIETLEAKIDARLN